MSVLTLERLGNCVVLTLNRPQALNAITTERGDGLYREAGGQLEGQIAEDK